MPKGRQRQNGLAEWEYEMMLLDNAWLTIGCGMALMTMAGALFRGHVPVGPSGTPTWHLRVSDLGPRRRHSPNTRVPAFCTLMQQATRRLLLPSRPPQSKGPTRPV